MKILNFEEFTKDKLNENIISPIDESKKEDKIKDRDELIERIKEEYIKQNSETTHKLDLTMLDVSMVEDMSYIFADKRNDKYPYAELESIDVSKWDVGNVINMRGMFSECSSLESIDVSKWDVSNVKDIKNMFNGCKFDYELQGNKLVKI